jgi:mannose-6-phosphate isomerase-like protein (cupin superfamily)
VKPISRFDASSEFYTPERCHIVEIHNGESDAGCSIARARVAPGITTQLHNLKGRTERYVILEGKGTVEVDGNPPEPVAPLDVVCIPEGVSQRIANTGDVDLVFLCICTPRFRKEDYVTMGS